MSMRRLEQRVRTAKSRRALVKRHRRYQRIATRHERRTDRKLWKHRGTEGYPFV